MPESGGEWNQHNYMELSHEVKHRISILFGDIDKDFGNRDCVLRSGVGKHDYEKIQFFTTSPEHQGEEIHDEHDLEAEVEHDGFENESDEIEEQQIRQPKKKITVKRNKKLESNQEKKVKFSHQRETVFIYDTKQQDSDQFQEDQASESDHVSDNEGFIHGGSGKYFKSFVPTAELQEEDQKTIEKVREAGYKVPKFDVLDNYMKLQQHFIDGQAQEFDDNKMVSKYAKIFSQGPKMNKTQAAAFFVARYRLKCIREQKRRKELLQQCTIAFFARKYF
jgi:hypothetical protein